MEITKDDLTRRMGCWLRIYMEWVERFYDLKTKEGKKALKELEDREYDVKNKIISAIDLLRE